ncbi:MAG: 16S rRNA processing protein RimM [Bacteroidales bacterium]|nr:16S rRNA processing protein RimM [Bacteroidales bacterium]
MTKEECYYLGRITKPFGVKGEMVLFLDVDNPEEYEQLDLFFVETKNGLVPYFVKSLRLNGNKAVVALEDVGNDELPGLMGRDLYLPLDLLPKLTGNQFYFHEIKGFKVVDEQHGDIGQVASVIEYPAQPLFQIMNGDIEILVPVIDQVIKKVDRDAKTIYIAAPNGLIDLYLEDNNKKC